MANTRVTRVQTEVAGSTTGMILRVTSVQAEILGTRTGNTARLYSIDLSTLADADGGITYNLTASDTLSLTQSASRQAPYYLTATDTLVLTQSAVGKVAIQLTASDSLVLTQLAYPSIRMLTASDALVLTQTNLFNKSYSRSASSALAFTQSALSNIKTRTAYSQLDLTINGHKQQQILLTASSPLALTQSALSNIKTRTAHSILALIQDDFTQVIIVGGIDRTASSTLSLNQAVLAGYVSASALVLTASSALALTTRAIFPKILSAASTLVLTQSNLRNPGKSATSELELTSVADVNKVVYPTATSAIGLEQSLTYELWRNGVNVGLYGGCAVTEQYSPFGGGSAIRPIPPPQTRFHDVEFFYPSGSPGIATESVVLRTPNFGNRDRNQYNRINRESRGGSLTIFRDPKWPKQRTLVMDFSGICDTEVDSILEFLDTTLGVKVGFRDWNGRLWSGVIVTPDAPVVRNGFNRNDLALELEVDEAELWLSASNDLPLSQAVARVVM